MQPSALEKGAPGDDVPLAFGENITHTNADMSEMLLGAMQSVSRDTALPPMPIKLHRAETCFVESPDPGEDGLVRHVLIEADVAGLQMDELRVELFQRGAPPHTLVVSTKTGEYCDYAPERWECDVHVDMDLRTVRAEFCGRGPRGARHGDRREDRTLSSTVELQAEFCGRGPKGSASR